MATTAQSAHAPPDLTPAQRSAFRNFTIEQIKKHLSDASAQSGPINLSHFDWTPHLRFILDRVLLYDPEDAIRKALLELPDKFDSRLKHAIRHEANHVAYQIIGQHVARSKTMSRSARPKSSYFRLNLTLPHKLDAKLSEIGLQARASGGFKLRKTEIIRALVMFLAEIEADLDLTGVRDEDQFLEQIRQAVGRGRAKRSG